MRYKRVNSLQLSFSGFLLVMGALILVAPHQFYYPEYSFLHRSMDLWGMVFIVLGAALLTLCLVRAPRILELAVYLSTAATLLLLAAGFASTQFWIWTANYALLGSFCLHLFFAAGSMHRAGAANRPGRTIDLFALFIGLVAVVTGLLILLVPASFIDPRYDLVRPFFWILAVIFFSTGILFFTLQILPKQLQHYEKIITLLGGVLFLLYSILVPLRAHVWPGILFYAGFGLMLILLPWIENRVKNINNPALLYTRLSLLLVIMVAIPLILTVTLISKIEERSVTTEVLERQRTQASSLAETIAHYITLHRAALQVLAGEIQLDSMDPAALTRLLGQFASAYPDVIAFSVFGQDGAPVARSDEINAVALSGYRIFDDVARSQKPVALVYNSPIYQRPVFAFSEPLFDRSGAFRGMVMISMDSQLVSNFINDQDPSGSALAYLVDDAGRVISHPDTTLVTNFANLSEQAGVRSLLNSTNPNGSLIFGPAYNRTLTAYSRVRGLGWGVVVERPAAKALGSVYSGRDIAFGILLAFLALAIAAGVWIAGWVSKPLENLEQAAAELAAGNNRIALPHSNVVEIQHLADAFGEMRLRLQERTAQRERAEQALRRANEELENRVAQRTADLEATARALGISNRELQDFAYITSHDLQEPLRKIQAFGDRLRKQAGGNMSPEGLDSLERMQLAAERMQKMINDLLSYSRVTTKIHPLTEVDLGEIIEDVISNLELRIEQTGGRVEVGVMPTLQADPTHMHQLFQNLIGNALKFHRADVPPVVKISSSEEQDGTICITVEDNGIGFSQEYAERIFQPFQRLHTRNVYEGNGIGLAICRKIIQRRGGVISAQSVPEEGTRFTINLPPFNHEQQQGEQAWLFEKDPSQS